MILNGLKKRSQPRAITLQPRSQNGHQELPAHTGEDLPAPRRADEGEQGARLIGGNDFVFLSDNVNCCVVRASEISLLEAYGNYTRVHLRDATVLIRRSLRKCECRLDPSTFFRTRRDCIVNLKRVKQMRVLDPKRFAFVLLDGKELIMSRKQSLLFRKANAL